MNIYTFTGHLGRSAEVRYTQGGTAVCSFSVAVKHGYGDREGTNWIRCSLFGKRAEGNLPQYLVKGAQVAVSGELRVRDYQDKDGITRTSVEVQVATLDLIGGKREEQPSSRQQEHGSPPDREPDPFAGQAGAAPEMSDDVPF